MTIDNHDIVIDPKENGPRGFANGGIAAGTLAELIGGTATVTLKAPVPVGVTLSAERNDDGVDLFRDGQLLAVATAADPFLQAPPLLPTIAEARAAWQAHPFRGLRNELTDCVVCGAERYDGLQVCFGPVSGHPKIFASPFNAPPTFGVEGVVRPEAIWGALDCPSYPAEVVRRGRIALLGQITVHRQRAVRVGEQLIVVGWTTSIGSRSFRTASALCALDGEVVASGRSVWIELKQTPDPDIPVSLD